MLRFFIGLRWGHLPGHASLAPAGGETSPHHAERVNIMRSPYEESYNTLYVAAVEAITILMESHILDHELPADVEHIERFTAPYVTAQMEKAGNLLGTALIQAEGLLQNATEEAEASPRQE